MINNSKILTVSYGTFSCTLEGFEDSFGTMKVIAEYFRDLAADDRYFGAEPPQPDAEMLARIAQKEVSRRVAAREQDGQIVLSALTDDAAEDNSIAPAPVQAAAVAAAPEIAELAAEPAATTEEESTTALVAAEAAAQDLAAAEDELETEIDTQALMQDIEIEDEAADALSVEIEDVAEVADEERAVEVEPEADDVADEEDAAEIAARTVAEAADDEIDSPDIVPGQPDADVEAFFNADADAADEVEQAEDEDDVSAIVDAPVEDAPAEDSIAAKLQRIRAVVSRQADVEPETDYSEDEHAESSDADPIAQARAEIEVALEADLAADLEAQEEAEAASQGPAAQADDELTALLSRVKASEQEPATAKLAEAFEDEDDAGEDTVNNLFEEEVEEEAQAEPAPQAPRARVIKVKRAEMEAALRSSELEEIEDDAETNAEDAREPRALDELAPAKRASTSLTREEEEELAQELTALKDDFDADEDDGFAEEDASANAGQPAAAAMSKLPALDAEDNTDVNRLLAETDQHMDEPEGANRRDAFAHLRAAVAARKADSSMDDDGQERSGTFAYREDLAEVVRPRRPTAGQARTERPDTARPAPLKLVAEQRVDVDAPQSADPVRPRRVAALELDEAAAQEQDSFAEFAEEMGAHSLSDKLEAAAAYLSFVEGREQFSRPQLMTKVRQAGGDEPFSREEGLRSFGQLLRKGKIEKIKGGRFTVSDDIGFRPDQRAAG